MRKMLQWDDLRLVLAVARAGTFVGAAAQLGSSTPTIFRQAKALEQRLGTLVFQRDNTGVSLTSAGREAASVAERIEVEIATLEAQVANEDSDASGTIRLATVDTLVAGPLLPVIANFRRKHALITLDLRTGIGMADVRQREVDAALRAGGEPPDSLVGRKLCRIAVAVYGSAAVDDAQDVQRDNIPWVVPDEELSHLASARWLKTHGHVSRSSLRVNSLHTLAQAVAHGMGLGILPCYLADSDARLVRIGKPINELASDLWFLTHNELRHTARMRKLSDFLASEFASLKKLFQGELPQVKAY